MLGAAAPSYQSPVPFHGSQMRMLVTQQGSSPVSPTPLYPTHSTKHLLLALPHLRASNLTQSKPKHPRVGVKMDLNFLFTLFQLNPLKWIFLVGVLSHANIPLFYPSICSFRPFTFSLYK